MRHPGAPSERELAERVVRLQTINAEMLEALENALPILRTIWQEPYEGDDWEERDEAIQDVIFGIDAAIAKAKGES